MVFLRDFPGREHFCLSVSPDKQKILCVLRVSVVREEV
jgi:hypothetical protein